MLKKKHLFYSTNTNNGEIVMKKETEELIKYAEEQGARDGELEELYHILDCDTRITEVVNLEEDFQEQIKEIISLKSEKDRFLKQWNDTTQALIKTMDQLEETRKERDHFHNIMEKWGDENLSLKKRLRELERKLLTINDTVVDTENYSVTIFGEQRKDGQGGYFEHHTKGEDCGGGLWFNSCNVTGNKELRDYDGVHTLPKQVILALKRQGIECNCLWYRNS